MCNQRGCGAQETGWRPLSFLCSSSFSHISEIVKHFPHQVPFSLWRALPTDHCSLSLAFDPPAIFTWLLKEDFSLFFSPFKGPFKPRPCLSSEAATLQCMALSPSHLTVHSGAGNWSELSFFYIWVDFQRQPKVVKVVWSSGVTPEMHGPTLEYLDLIGKTPRLPISGLVEVFLLTKTASNLIWVKSDTQNPSCYITIWPWAAEMDKKGFLQPLFLMIIPSSSSQQECFHGFSVSNRLCVVPSHALLMIDIDGGVIQVDFGNWEWLSEMNFFPDQIHILKWRALGADKAWRKKHHSTEQDENDRRTAWRVCFYSDPWGALPCEF